VRAACLAHNDPHQERDFGSFEFLDRRWCFKIDYFDLSMHCGSPDPADPAVTTRVMTVMAVEDH
jgi:hypothetical protein